METYTRLIPEHPGAGRLGRHVEHDPRSRDFPALVDSAAPLQTVHHRTGGLPLDQGNVGSCTGNACAGALNTQPLHVARGRYLTEVDALALYESATLLDTQPGSYPPTDTGSSGLAVAKAAKAKGLISAYRHAFGIEGALGALQQGPVITGVHWYESFDQPDSAGMVWIGGQVRGGHEFVVVGYVAQKVDPYVVAMNSWGKTYGLSGRYKFTVDTWTRLLAEDGDVTILVR